MTYKLLQLFLRFRSIWLSDIWCISGQFGKSHHKNQCHFLITVFKDGLRVGTQKYIFLMCYITYGSILLTFCHLFLIPKQMYLRICITCFELKNTWKKLIKIIALWIPLLTFSWFLVIYSLRTFFLLNFKLHY